jgi:hypothetical protein
VVNTILVGMKGRGMVLIGFGRPPPAGGHVAILTPVFYDGTEEEGKAAFKPLLDLGPILNIASSVPYNTCGRMIHVPQGKRVSMKGASFTLPLRFDFVQETLDTFTKFTEEVPETAQSLLLYEIFDTEKICAVGNAEMGFANRGSYLNAMVGPLWEGPERDEVCRAWARETAELFKRELVRGKSEEEVRKERDGVMVYGNYDRESTSGVGLLKLC